MQRHWGLRGLAALVAVMCSLTAPAAASARSVRQAGASPVRIWTIHYRAHDGLMRPAYVVLPSWYGVGAALEEYLAEDGERLAQLQHMYRSWPFLRAFLDNLQMTLSKADMHIAHHYSLLVDDEALRQRLSTNIAEEYQRTRRMLLQIVGGKALLDTTPVLQRSIRLRNPYVDPLSYFQVALLRRLRAIGGPLVLDETEQQHATDRERERANLTYAVLLTINGIAAGLRNTG